jgi:arylsulfatase A-like enzyme
VVRSARASALLLGLLPVACGVRRAPDAAAGPESLARLARTAELRSDTLDLAFLLARQNLRARGWLAGESEPAGPPWNRRATSTLALPFDSTDEKRLVLRARARPDAGPGLALAVELNGVALGSLPLGPDEARAELAVPRGAQVPGENVISFSLSGLAERERPRELWRLLALEVRPARGSSASLPAVDSDAVRLPAGSSMTVYLAARPASELRLTASAAGAAARLTVRLESSASTRTLADALVPEDRSHRLRAPLAAPVGAFLRLEIACRGSGGLRLTGHVGGAAEPPRRHAAPARLPGTPNLVLFLTDTLRADALGAYGGPAAASPRFDAFAREATLFEDAWAQASWTQPAVASIFTSLHVGSHGLGGPDHVLAAGLTTLPESLKAAGYRTGAFVANPVVNRRLGFTQGFDAWNPGPRELAKAPAAAVVEQALAWAGQAGGPFFLYVHTLDPHSPYEPPETDWAPFRPGAYRGERDSFALLRRERFTADELVYLRSRYLGEVRTNDAAFGVLLEGLRGRGLLDGSVVVFTADHGEEFQDHGGMEHAHTLYQEQLRIPMAVRLPGARHAGRRETAVVQQIDLFPTLAGLVGARVPPEAEGRDLSAAWLGRADFDRAPRESCAELAFGQSDKLALRVGAHKLVVNDDPPRQWRAGAHLELYDLARDPAERENLAAADAFRAGYLRRRALELGFAHAATRLRLRAGGRTTLTEAELEQLRALGYVQ